MRRDLALAGWQVRYEQLAFWRNRRSAILSFAFPVILLVFFGSLNQGERLPEHGGITFITFFLPGILAYAVVTTTFSNLVVSLAAARDGGVLKRVQGTPLPWWAYVAGRIGSALCVVTAMTVLVLVLGAVALGAQVRVSTLPGLLLAVALGAACFTTLGVGLVRLLPSADSAGPMQAIAILPMALISGVFFPLDGAPRWLSDVADALPLRPLADALQHAFDPRTTGAGIAGADLLHLLLWTAVGTWLMLRFVRTLTRQG